MWNGWKTGSDSKFVSQKQNGFKSSFTKSKSNSTGRGKKTAIPQGSSAASKGSWNNWKSTQGHWEEQSNANFKTTWSRNDWKDWGQNSKWETAKSASNRNNSSASAGSWADRESIGEWRRIEQQEEVEFAKSPPRRSVNGSAKVTSQEAGSGESRKRRRDEDVSSPDRRPKRIKVTNVPRDLSERDVKAAFELETGKVLDCVLKDRTAYITFARSEDARKAVANFDRGELNGKTISATIDN
jgi:hypothetical protein